MSNEKNNNLQVRLEKIEEKLKDKTNENDVKVMMEEYAKLKKIVTEEELIVILDKRLNEKKYMTESDVDTKTSKVQLTMIKWVIGTVISGVALVIAILRIIF
ncbi:MAG: hypothetical protein LRY73_20245 [Bacillus sp. (in: Bacteria)]|nr:hypothetical protein [Bacillus sp. (in: firmicutes)]